MTRTTDIRQELKFAKALWGKMGSPLLTMLLATLEHHDLSIIRGELLLLDGKWYVTHPGLLRIASRKHCCGIRVQPIREFSDRSTSSFVFRATVYTSTRCKGFVGYGDADPANVSPLVRGAEMRVAETRAVNRALRKAYGIGICSVEELGATGGRGEQCSEGRKRTAQPSNCNSWGSGPRVRDRLCQLIRQHQLDPGLVKAYAVDFCGVKNLKEATRAQVEAFVEQLADWAEKDRNALLCQLNSYFRVKEAQGDQKPQPEGAA